MSIEFVGSQESSSDDLPWAKDFLNIDQTGNNLTCVVEIKKTTKGYLVLGKAFKGFVFDQSKLYTFISDATPYWKSSKSLPYLVIMSVSEKGKIDLGVDRDGESTVYIDKKGNISFKYSDGDTTSQEKNTNPFLIQTLPPTKSVEPPMEQPNGSSSKKKTPF